MTISFDMIFSIVVAVVQLVFVVVCICRGNSSGLKSLSKTILELYDRYNEKTTDSVGDSNNIDDVDTLSSLVVEKLLEVLKRG